VVRRHWWLAPWLILPAGFPQGHHALGRPGAPPWPARSDVQPVECPRCAPIRHRVHRHGAQIGGRPCTLAGGATLALGGAAGPSGQPRLSP